MRHVNRLARHARANLRRPPPRRWASRARVAALAVLALGGVGFAAEALWRSPATARMIEAMGQQLAVSSARAGFVVTRVYSEGRTLADERSLQKALEPYYGKPILQVDLNGLKERVEGVPWIRSASIGRRLPDTLWIRLEEHRPIARWLDGSRQVLVSDAGQGLRDARVAARGEAQCGIAKPPPGGSATASSP